jgi:hypothetical protein
MKANPDRIPCVVPFCKRTGKRRSDDDETAEIICRSHGAAIDKRLLRLHQLVTRRFRALEMREENRAKAEKLFRQSERLWTRMKAQAIGRAL